jgi:RNA polymerase sigma factor (TIGR02999 family)
MAFYGKGLRADALPGWTQAATCPIWFGKRTGSAPLGDITQLLRAASAGDRVAADGLFALMYDELKDLARRSLRRTGHPPELNTTTLVHETFLKLNQGAVCTPAERLAFYSYMGKVMRSVVLDAVRESRARKRGGDQVFVELTTGALEQPLNGVQLLELDDALNTLANLAPELKELVELRYFAGLTMAETSELTGKSLRTVEREWEKARLLLRELIAES